MAQIDDWMLERNKKGIRVFTKKSKWGKLKDSKAEMLVSNSSIDDLVKLITNFDNYSNWLPRCRVAKVVARISDNEFIGYMVFKCPWPLPDRDCAVRVKVDKAPNGTVTITETSEPKYVSKHSDIVRIEQLSSVWKLVPGTGGILVSNENATNPGGNIPDWLTNTQAVDNPFDIFTTIQTVIPQAKSKGK